MKNNEITKVTRQSELARAAALEAAGEHGDAAQVRYMVEKTWPETCAVPRTCHDLLPGDTAEQYKPAVSEYEQQAQDFLSRNGLKFRATLSDSKTPAWAKEGEETGHHYRVSLSRPFIVTAIEGSTHYKRPTRLVFDFWGSVEDAGHKTCPECDGKKKVLSKEASTEERPHPRAGEPCTVHGEMLYESMMRGSEARREQAKRMLGGKQIPVFPATTCAPYHPKITCPCCNGCGSVKTEEIKHPSAYDVLACISGDAYTPETFADFCAEYGYESDSIKALQQFRRCDRFAKRLRAFFTESELQELSEIR